MALQGDFTTLEPSGLLQNLEQQRKSGTLTVEGAEGASRLYFADGCVALFTREARPPLVEVLVGAGHVSREQLDDAKTARKGTRRTLVNTLVELGAVSDEAVRELAKARLMTEACELVMSMGGEFRFDEGAIPRNTFDPEERKLALAIPAGPLLLEAARRSDHWAGIRSRVPDDDAHYVVQKPHAREELRNKGDALGFALFERLDGTRTVTEALAPFTHVRFEAYQSLAGLAERGVVRILSADDLARLAEHRLEFEPEEAWRLVARGLKAAPSHKQLLEQRVQLASSMGKDADAVEALKLLAHGARKDGALGEAALRLEEAAELAPHDLVIAERLMEIAREQRELDEVSHATVAKRAKGLAHVMNELGLVTRSVEVLAGLVAELPDDVDAKDELDLLVTLAGSLAETGSLHDGVERLERLGRARLAEERWEDARDAYQAAVELDPGCESAKQTLIDIDSGLFVLKKARRRQRIVASISLLLGFIGVATLVVELSARRAWMDAEHQLLVEGLLEDRRYGEAIDRLEAVRAAHPWSSYSRFEIPDRLELLESRLIEESAALRLPEHGEAIDEPSLGPR